MPEMGHGFPDREAAGGDVPGTQQAIQCPLGLARMLPMVGQKRGLHVFYCRQCLRELSMQSLASVTEQAGIARIPNQRMLEAVSGCRRCAVPEDQPRCDQLPQCRVEMALLERAEGGQQLMWELAADDRRDLRHLLDRAEAVEPGHQRVAQRSRNRHGRKGAYHLVPPASISHSDTSTALVTSSANSGTPSVPARIRSSTTGGNCLPPAMPVTNAAT